jgi:Protein of unknown function (DUF3106)
MALSAVAFLSATLALSANAQTASTPEAPSLPAESVNSAPAAEDSASSSPAPASSAEAPPASPPRSEPLKLDPPRASAIPLAQPLWADLTNAQRQVLEPFESQWNGLPATEKRAWADIARRFPKMSADEQARVQKRIAEWAGLSPAQRQLARANYRLAQQTGRENIAAQWETYQGLTSDQKSVLGNAGSTSNTAARYAGSSTGLAKEAAQPLPRRPVLIGTDNSPASASGVVPTVGKSPRP